MSREMKLRELLDEYEFWGLVAKEYLTGDFKESQVIRCRIFEKLLEET